MAKFISSSCLICTYKPAAASRWQKACDNLQLKKFRNFLNIVPFNANEAWHQYYRIITNAILKHHHSSLFALDTYAMPHLTLMVKSKHISHESAAECTGVCRVLWNWARTPHILRRLIALGYALANKISQTAFWHPCYTDTASEVDFSHK